MHADQYETAVRTVTGSQTVVADEFRDGTLGGDWSVPRKRLSELAAILQKELSSLDCEPEIIHAMDLFGIGCAVENLGNERIQNTEAAFLAVANLITTLKYLLDSVKDRK